MFKRKSGQNIFQLSFFMLGDPIFVQFQASFEASSFPIDVNPSEKYSQIKSSSSPKRNGKTGLPTQNPKIISKNTGMVSKFSNKKIFVSKISNNNNNNNQKFPNFPTILSKPPGDLKEIFKNFRG